ncbi:MAG: hypothetical protein ACK5LS_03955 [Propioniciclava sp.]
MSSDRPAIVSPWLRLAYVTGGVAILALGVWLAAIPDVDRTTRMAGVILAAAAAASVVRLAMIGAVVEDDTIVVRNPLRTHRIASRRITRVGTIGYDGALVPDSAVGRLSPFRSFASPVLHLMLPTAAERGPFTPQDRLELTCLAGSPAGAAYRAESLADALRAQGRTVLGTEESDPGGMPDTMVDWSIGPLPPRARRSSIPGQPEWGPGSRRRPDRALPSLPREPRPVRFLEWLTLTVFGPGVSGLSWTVVSLLFALVAVIPLGLGEQSAHLTALTLTHSGTTATATSCEARYGRALTELRVTVPGVADAITLAYPDPGVLLRLISANQWVECPQEYAPPLQVSYAVQAGGGVIALASEDLASLVSPWAPRIILGVGFAMVLPVAVWAVWAWLALRWSEGRWDP